MKILFALIITVVCNFTILAADIQADLSLISQPEILKDGDLLEGVLKVWPIENIELEQFQQLENMVIGGALVVTQIDSAIVSPNNADVAEVKLQFIVKKMENGNAIFNYKGQSVTINVPPLKLAPSEKNQEDYIILDQGLLSSQVLKLLLLICAFLVLVVAIVKRAKIVSFIMKLKSDPVAIATKKFNAIFMKAESRADFEEIYSLRKEWLKLIKIQAQAYAEFLNKMEQHQYKRDWLSGELGDVKSSFEIIRGSFK